jgi:hypothetical protein
MKVNSLESASSITSNCFEGLAQLMKKDRAMKDSNLYIVLVV